MGKSSHLNSFCPLNKIPLVVSQAFFFWIAGTTASLRTLTERLRNREISPYGILLPPKPYIKKTISNFKESPGGPVSPAFASLISGAGKLKVLRLHAHLNDGLGSSLVRRLGGGAGRILDIFA